MTSQIPLRRHELHPRPRPVLPWTHPCEHHRLRPKKSWHNGKEPETAFERPRRMPNRPVKLDESRTRMQSETASKTRCETYSISYDSNSRAHIPAKHTATEGPTLPRDHPRKGDVFTMYYYFCRGSYLDTLFSPFVLISNALATSTMIVSPSTMMRRS